MRSVWRGAVLAALGFVGIAVTAPPARAGIISLALSVGAAGGDAPTESNGFKFTNPSGSTDVAIDQLVTAETVKASTSGGSVFFGGSGLPVLLNLADGSAYITSATAPETVKPVIDVLASMSPFTGDIPTGAALLGLTVSDPAIDGIRVVSVVVRDAAGEELGGTQVAMPDGGWWVLGLMPADVPPPPPIDPAPVDPVPPPDGVGGPEDPGIPPPVPVILPGPVVVDVLSPGAVATPEPATLALAGLGIALIPLWRRRPKPSQVG